MGVAWAERIPDDLLLDIFEILDSESDWVGRGKLALPLVCKRWRNVSEGHAGLSRLWRYFVIQGGSSFEYGRVLPLLERRAPMITTLCGKANGSCMYGHGGIGEGGAVLLSQVLPGCKRLTNLSLNDNRIGQEGGVLLAPSLPISLTRLNLGSNSLGAEGAQALFGVVDVLPNLHQLYLASNHIGNAGAVAAAESLPHSALQILDLSKNYIAIPGEFITIGWHLHRNIRVLTSSIDTQG